MTDSPPRRSLSRTELMVLARLTSAKPPTEAEIVKAFTVLGMPLSGPALADSVAAALVALEGLALVERRLTKPTKKRPKPVPRFALANSGDVAFRKILGLEQTPTWAQTCTHIVPALALGLTPWTEQAKATLTSSAKLIIAILRRETSFPAPRTVAELCDQLIAEKFGMPSSRVTPASLRACVLAAHFGIHDHAGLDKITRSVPPAAAKTDPALAALASSLASQHLHAESTTKPALIQALQRHWLSNQDQSDDAHRLAAQAPAPVDAHNAGTVPAAFERLLSAVRGAIPMIGAKGRYGRANVFVSALWRQLSRNGLQDLTLDDFKEWLVRANRDELLNLARADLVDAMDARLVEDSRIENLGATFHFVIDPQQTVAARYSSHAR